MLKQTLGSLLALGLMAGGALVVAPATDAATPTDYTDLVQYAMDGHLGSYEVACHEANKTGTPYSYTGKDTGVSGTASSTYDAVDSSGKVIATFRTSGSLASSMDKAWDGSLSGSVSFHGHVSVDTKVGGSCIGYGDHRATYTKVLRAERAGTFTISGTAQGVQYTSLTIQTYGADASGMPDGNQATTVLDLAESGNDSNGHPRTVTFSKTVSLLAGQYVALDGRTDVAGESSYGSYQPAGGPVSYLLSNRDGDGTLTLSYGLRLAPAPGQQVAPTPAKAAHLVTLPANLNCTSHRFTFKVAKAKRVRSVTVYAGKKRVKTFTHVKRTLRVKLKPSTTKVRIALRYKSGKQRTVTKAYHSCR